MPHKDPLQPKDDAMMTLPGYASSPSQPAPAGGFSLSGKRVLITGAAGAIGSATARVCASLGAQVVMVDRSENPGPVADLVAAGHRYERCDIRVRQAVEVLCADVGVIDALVLNAGIFMLEDWQDADWDRHFEDVMAVNFIGAVNFSRALLPSMKERPGGRIVLTGSVAGRTGGSHANSPMSYGASKGALHSFMRWLARRAAPEVMVNAVAPGPIATPMTATADRSLTAGIPVGRFGEAEEIAWPIAFLCSPAASYICGAILDVNGGLYTA